MKTVVAFGLLTLAICCASVQADSFGSGANSFNIDFVTIGNPTNPADTTGSPNPAGSVDHVYRIGKFEVAESMINKANALGGLGLTHDNRGANKPATSITWFEAAKFVNWLNTSTGGAPAYKFDGSGNFQLWVPSDAGYNPNNRYRNNLARYFLPSVHEWYKAAYYDATSGVYYDYPIGSNVAPTPVASGTSPGTAVYLQTFGTGPADITLAGGLSPYGTMAQGGNAWEWEETDFDLTNDSTSSPRGSRGGDWFDPELDQRAAVRGLVIFPSDTQISFGFRVASIPEPSAFLLAMLASAPLWARRKR